MREAGILLHLTSLPGKYGIGNLGKKAYQFVDFLEKCNLKLWQILPLTPTGYGDSPYQSFAAGALNYYLIDLEELQEQGLLEKDYLDSLDFGSEERVDYGKQFALKIKLLKEAFAVYQYEDDFRNFIESKKANDFALYMTLKENFANKSWFEWPLEYKMYNANIENEVRNKYAQSYDFWVWTQYLFLKQWYKLKKYANQKGVKIIGDIPLYVGYDSVEVWKYGNLFLLNDKREMTFVAGCPPDAFSETGQLWGNPLYNWEVMAKDNYKWWHERIDNTLELVDILRIDHFRGFDRFYAIPNGSVDARQGLWLSGPKIDLFKDILDLNIIAEDLGVLDDGVRKLMSDVGYPGMKILEFAFDGNPENEHKPSNYTENCVCYTGTHDNETLKQFITKLDPRQYEIYMADLAKQLGAYGLDLNTNSVDGVIWKVIELAMASKAKMTIIPMQDFLCQGEEARMNFPSMTGNNWSYRVLEEDFSSKLEDRIREVVLKYGR